jgi:hypothetical protein
MTVGGRLRVRPVKCGCGRLPRPLALAARLSQRGGRSGGGPPHGTRFKEIKCFKLFACQAQPPAAFRSSRVIRRNQVAPHALRKDLLPAVCFGGAEGRQTSSPRWTLAAKVVFVLLCDIRYRRQIFNPISGSGRIFRTNFPC